MHPKFLAMLNTYPRLLPLWNVERSEYKPEQVNHYLGVASHGEAIMLRFFLAVWRGDNSFDFNIIDAAATLDAPEMQIITNWLTHPFWP